MNSVIALFRDLLLLRRGPQDLPYSPALLAALCVFSLLLDLLLASLLAEGAAPLGRVMFSLLMLIGLPAVALSMAGLSPRLLQTATALVGTGVVFSILALPVVAGIGELPVDPSQVKRGQLVLSLVLIALGAYQVAIKGHILRHAMDVPLRAGVLLAIAFFAIELVLGAALFGSRSV